MKRLSNLEYLKLSRIKKIGYKLLSFICGIPMFFLKIFKAIWKFIKKIGLFIKNEAVTIVKTFVKGSWKTKVSYLIMGFSNLSRKQFIKGFLFLAFEGIFIWYMISTGSYWLSKFDNLGDTASKQVYDEVLDVWHSVEVSDNSFKILLYGLLTIIFIIALVGTWRINISQARINDEIERDGKKLKTDKDDLKSLLDTQFHKTMLALPVMGIAVFTLMPMLFMILVAFTNYDGTHNGYSKLFTWVGWDNFNALISWGSSSGSNLTATFGEILAWTLIWAFFATFTNYFLGMIVAMLINKKGIKCKKLFRTILVLTIAIPQFISLLYISHVFDKTGFLNAFLVEHGIFKSNYNFWGNAKSARILVILINIWIGIPYLMLIITGVLMNIPQDLYESAKIDGANVFQQYTKITLPYVLFVTGPYLLTSFIGNINNFNVIFLLTGGGPVNTKLNVDGQTAGSTDLLITWLFNLTTGTTSNYKLASVIGILIFFVVATLSLIVYNVIPSTRNEEDYS